MLAIDLDPGRAGCDVHDAAAGRHHERRAVRAAEVRTQAEALAGLVARCDGQVLADVSPSGGRHVYVLFAAPLPWLELRDVVRALALRFPAIDTAPVANLGGQISPPGARHKSGGWRVLSVPLEEARAAAEHPCGPEVWAALLTELAAELRHVEQQAAKSALANCEPSAELDDTGVPWVPRLGGRAPLGAELEHAARSGRWDRSRYAGRSEARMAIVAAAAVRGWQLAEIRAAVASEAWKGLAALYERRSEPGRMARLLPLEWRKAIGFVAGEKNVRDWPTSDRTSRPPIEESASPAEYGLIREWLTAILCAAEDPERVRGWGRRAVAVRLVLLALGQAAMVSGSSTIEFGRRNLALYSALSDRTVSRVLRILRDEPDPLIDLVSPRRLARADRYALRIPDRYADSVRWRRRRAGRVEAIDPVFLVLGGTAGLVYQVLSQDEERGAEVARTARLSASATSAALRVLAEHGLAERGPGGWRRGSAARADVAESTGAATLQREREARYRQDREGWRARLRQYQGSGRLPVTSRDGWWPLDDEDEYDEMCRWPVLSDDFVRGPPSAEARETA
jgi:DNA-binding transcriptional ArsR family regulator